jgi:hypothetical protein
MALIWYFDFIYLLYDSISNISSETSDRVLVIYSKSVESILYLICKEYKILSSCFIVQLLYPINRDKELSRKDINIKSNSSLTSLLYPNIISYFSRYPLIFSILQIFQSGIISPFYIILISKNFISFSRNENIFLIKGLNFFNNSNSIIIYFGKYIKYYQTKQIFLIYKL